MDDQQIKLQRAAALRDAQAWDEAAVLYEELLAEFPDDPGLLCSLGTVELFRRRLDSSVTILERAAELAPGSPEVRNQLGMAYKTLQRWGDASKQFETALQIDSGFAASYFHLGEMAMSLGQWDAAVSLYRQCIGLAPRVIEPHLALGNLLFTHGNWEGAEQCFRAALTMADEMDAAIRLDVQSRLGLTLLKRDRLDQAEAVFREMQAAAPLVAEIHSNLAFVLERQGKLAEAIEAARRAVELNPTLADAHNNLGVACRSAHQLDAAEAAFRRAVELKPDFSLGSFNLASVQLMREDYRNGWAGYEHRQVLIGGPPRHSEIPRWTGEPIEGGALLLHAEQGYGDTIQFIRFARTARERSGALIVAEVPAPLATLLERAAGVDVCIPFGQPLPEVVAQAPLPSLPGILGVEATQLSAGTSYLNADSLKLQEWNARLQSHCSSSRLRRIGVCWSGNPDQSQNRNRSCPLVRFARLAGLEGVKWFSLQKDIRGPFEDQSRLGLIPLGSHLQTFDETAAAISALDLVITVDTSVAHLAGALGRPTWTLLSHTPDWRWQLDRADSPWYPSMRLFRQPRWGDWDAVIADVRTALVEFLTTGSADHGRPLVQTG